MSQKKLPASPASSLTDSQAGRPDFTGAAPQSAPEPEPEPVTLQSIAVARQPDKMDYLEGDAFNPSGMVLTAAYSDGSTRTIDGIQTCGDQNVIWDLAAFPTEGTHQVTLSMCGRTTALPVAVRKHAVERLTVTGFQDSYTVGETFDPAGMVVTVLYSDGVTQTIRDIAACGDQDVIWDTAAFLTAGDRQVTLYYGGRSATLPVAVQEPVLERIQATGSRKTYITGQAFDPAGLVVTATYSDGSTRTIRDITACGDKNVIWDVAAFPVAGTHLVNIFYGGRSAALPVTVQEPTVESIRVTGAKRTYTIGDAFDPAGLVVAVAYSDGSTRIIRNITPENSRDVSWETAPFTAAGACQVAVSFGGKTAVLPVTVQDPTVESICAAGCRTAYLVGEAFDPAGLTVTVLYSNGTTQTIRDVTPEDNRGVSWDRYAFTAAGTYQIAVSFGGKTTVLPVTVQDPTVESICAAGCKETYTVGEAFDPTGLVVTAFYSNGTVQTIRDITPEDNKGVLWGTAVFLTAGDCQVTLFYGGRTTSVPVHVQEPAVEAIQVTGCRTAYSAGEAFDPAGMMVTALYSDGSTRAIQDITPEDPRGVSWDANVFFTPGDHQVTVSFGGKSAALPVHVQALTVESIQVTGFRDTYFAGQAFDPAGMVVTAAYSDGSTYIIDGITPEDPKGVSWDVDVFSTPGRRQVTVSFGGKSAAFQVTVQKPTVERLAVTGFRSTYTVGEPFDPAGLVVTATYSDGSVQTMDGLQTCGDKNVIWDVAAFPMAGTHQVTVSFGGKTAAFPVTVQADSPRDDDTEEAPADDAAPEEAPEDVLPESEPLPAAVQEPQETEEETIPAPVPQDDAGAEEAPADDAPAEEAPEDVLPESEPIPADVQEPQENQEETIPEDVPQDEAAEEIPVTDDASTEAAPEDSLPESEPVPAEAREPQENEEETILVDGPQDDEDAEEAPADDTAPEEAPEDLLPDDEPLPMIVVEGPNVVEGDGYRYDPDTETALITQAKGLQNLFADRAEEASSAVIQLTAHTTYPVDTASMPLAHSFQGSLRGAGATILIENGQSGLFHQLEEGASVQDVIIQVGTIAGSADQYGLGAVAGANSGTIRNCRVTGGTITAAGQGAAGGIVGTNDGSIMGCRVDAAVITGDHISVGGIAGASSGQITGCCASGDVSGIGGGDTGGVVGTNNSGTVSACCSTGTITGSAYTGGVVGCNDGSSAVTGCCSTGIITGGYNIGGVAGYNDDNSSADACYWSGSPQRGIGFGSQDHTDAYGFTRRNQGKPESWIDDDPAWEQAAAAMNAAIADWNAGHPDQPCLYQYGSGNPPKLTRSNPS